jgi:hypothetical protein
VFLCVLFVVCGCVWCTQNKEVQEKLTAAPSRRSLDVSELRVTHKVVGEVWRDAWNQTGSRRSRKNKFEARRRRQKCLANTVNRLLALATDGDPVKREKVPVAGLVLHFS